MEEKINEEFVKKDWSIDYDKEQEEYYLTCLKLINKVLSDTILENKTKIEKIKELIEELENEING